MSRLIKNRNYIRICICICILIPSWETTVRADQPLKITFRSRALLDATLSGYDKESVQGYYRLDDFRVGFKATYDRFEVKADAGLEGGKASVKDLLLNYHFKKSILSFGNGYEPFSMDKLISTASRSFHQPAGSTLAYTNSRKVGVTYHSYASNYYWAAGVYTHNDINKLGENQKNAFVATGRAVWRKLQPETQTSFHVGGAFSYRTQEKNTVESTVGEIESDGITTLFTHPLLEVEIPDMGTEMKGMLEVLYLTPRFLLQAECYYDQMNRSNDNRIYRAYGGYVQGGFLVMGRQFEYDLQYAIPGRPVSAQAIEITARFNYANMNDTQAGIFGGEEKDVSVGVNFYLNKYFGLKVNGSYVWVGDHCNDFYNNNFFLAQVRMQYTF